MKNLFDSIRKHVLNVLESLSVKICTESSEKDKKALARARKAVDNIRLYIDDFMHEDIEKLHVVISKGNRKIGRVLNVSLAPIITCCNCSGCMKLCYDIKAVLQYSNVAKARAKNYVLLMRDRDKYFSEIAKACSKRRTNKFLRFHVSGDIIDIDYFDRMVKLARQFPDFKMWTYTKAYHIVNKWCELNGKENVPNNLSVMFSEWRGMPMNNPYKFPEFKVVFKDEEKPVNVKWCCGNCELCIKNNSHCVKGETVYCMEH